MPKNNNSTNNKKQKQKQKQANAKMRKIAVKKYADIEKTYNIWLDTTDEGVGRKEFTRMLKAGQNWKNLPLDLQKEAMGKSFYSGGGKTGFLRRLAWNRPSPTVPTHPAMPATDLCHPVKNRPLSVQEYKRIQQLPDNFELSGNLLQQYKQLGNAVPVGLGEAVGRTLIDHLNGSNWSEEEIPDFKFSRYKNTNELNWKKS